MEWATMIHHRPKFDIHAIEQFYSNKDGVEVRYVCTSAIDTGTSAGDIFFRETPHPEFGNRYFIIASRFMEGGVSPTLTIASADIIEDLDFEMIKGTNGWEYSQHRHDFYEVLGTGLAIDGGRAYCRLVGNNMAHEPRAFRVKDGKFEVK